MEREDGSHRSFFVPQGVMVIGRGRRTSIRIPLPSIELKHCELLHEDGRLTVRDLDSDLGILVNGQKVNEADLAHTDRLTVGPVTFRICFDRTSADEVGSITELKPARLSAQDGVPPAAGRSRHSGTAGAARAGVGEESPPQADSAAES